MTVFAAVCWDWVTLMMLKKRDGQDAVALTVDHWPASVVMCRT